MAKRDPNPFNEFRAAAWDEVANANSGQIPNLEMVEDLLLEKVGTVGMETLHKMAARLAVQAEDKIRTTIHATELQLAFPGWPAPPDKFWKMGDGRRVRIRAGTGMDHRDRVRQVENNAREIEDSRRAAVDDYQRLQPYYDQGIQFISEAVAAYLADQGQTGSIDP